MELVLLIGLPGAGKSTFFRERFASTHVHVSKDNFPNHKRPEKRQRLLIGEALGEGTSVVVDNTNASPEERASSIEIGRNYGAEIIGFFFEITSAESLERNEARPEAERVPTVGIYATAKRLRPPILGEGFDRLYRVRASDGDFLVDDFYGQNGTGTP